MYTLTTECITLCKHPDNLHDIVFIVFIHCLPSIYPDNQQNISQYIVPNISIIDNQSNEYDSHIYI